MELQLNAVMVAYEHLIDYSACSLDEKNVISNKSIFIRWWAYAANFPHGKNSQGDFLWLFSIRLSDFNPPISQLTEADID